MVSRALLVIPDRTLSAWVSDARQRSISLVEDLTDEQLDVPLLPTVNPFVWELCHLAYFQELWVLRRGAGQAPAMADADRLFDSTTIAHENRWRLPVPDRDAAIDYAQAVERRVQECLAVGADDRLRYLLLYSVFHEDMHIEALSYTRQALGCPAPAFPRRPAPAAEPGGEGDVAVGGGAFELGFPRGGGFCFDNEKWAHRTEVEPFSIAARAVTEAEFAAFVDDAGYRRRELWSPVGWAWRVSAAAELPLYWRPDEGGYERRSFDRWQQLQADRAMMHVNYHEAEAYCRWAGRRLPTEAEWEFAAAAHGSRAARGTPWGGDRVDAERANVDGVYGDAVGVGALSSGDSPAGCRQLMGNVWEWTSTTFAPYPGFEPDMYEDYSQTSFHTRKVLRGGCWVTPSRLLRNTWRNFFQPTRRDVFAGFRTCALE